MTSSPAIRITVSDGTSIVSQVDPTATDHYTIVLTRKPENGWHATPTLSAGSFVDQLTTASLSVMPETCTFDIWGGSVSGAVPMQMGPKCEALAFQFRALSRARMWKYHLPGLSAVEVASWTLSSTSFRSSGTVEAELSHE